MQTSTEDRMDIAYQMTTILGSCVAALAALVTLQTPIIVAEQDSSTFRPNPKTEPSKRFYEAFVAVYTVVWIACFGVIVIFELYEQFTPWMYILVCGGLAMPFLLQPFLLPGPHDRQRPFWQRYSFRANVWLAIYSFIGNYWYTHYFYSVLKAEYTMPNAIRLNNVPIAMFCATHFYFSSYHFFSNSLLRKILTSFQRTVFRDLLFVGTIAVFAYFTAFMETLSISAFPYWTFADRNLAYSIGSAFYGIYFIFSFPAFYFFDRRIDQVQPQPLWDVVVSSCGYGMMILLVLDFVRLYLGISLVVGGSNS